MMFIFWLTHLHKWENINKVNVLDEENDIIGVRFFQQCSHINCRKYRRTSFT